MPLLKSIKLVSYVRNSGCNNCHMQDQNAHFLFFCELFRAVWCRTSASVKFTLQRTLIKGKEAGSVCLSWQNCIRLTSISHQQQTLILRIVCNDVKTHLHTHTHCASSHTHAHTYIHNVQTQSQQTFIYEIPEYLKRLVPRKR